MAKPYSVDTLIDYAFRRLGEPVIDINVDRQQAEERVEDALDFFTERHFDGVQKTFHKHKVTGDDITNGYINTSGITLGAGMTGQPEGKDLLSVTKVLRFGGSQASMFSVRYQMSLNDYFGVNRHMGGGGGYANGLAGYDATKRYISLVEQYFEPEKQFRFSKVQNRLYVDMDWSKDTDEDETFILIEGYSKLDPITYTEIYDDRLLKEYVTALIKRQWGANLSKFEGVQLPGGVSMRGAEIFAEGQEEVLRIEEKVLLEYELPIDFIVG
tara:strand:- start:291 stop:1100 length:810 start_codon:yes stop_codon:yes gene_type:complete